MFQFKSILAESYARIGNLTKILMWFDMTGRLPHEVISVDDHKGPNEMVFHCKLFLRHTTKYSPGLFLIIEA